MSKNNKSIKEIKSVAGLLNLTFEHEVKDTKYTFRWDGPKITREEWQKMLAFFKWTYDTTKSESQVRLYVHPQHGWRAWAFPQKAKTGMSAQELDTPETQVQRAQFTDDWLYFGTVHHHCAAGAFQSGVDTANEENQDGLHITVGHMDKEQYDIDARLYIGGRKLKDISLAMFWQVDGVIAGLPVWVRDLLPKDADHKAAKRQMGEPAPAGCEFPEQWRANLIYEPPPVQVPRDPLPHVYNPGNNAQFRFKAGFIQRAKPKLLFDLNRANDEIENWMLRQDAFKNLDPKRKDEPDWSMDAVVQLLYEMAGKLHDEEMELFDILCRNDILPEDFVDHAEKEMEKQAERELAKEAAGGNNGAPAKDPLTPAEQEALEEMQWQNWRGM